MSSDAPLYEVFDTESRDNYFKDVFVISGLDSEYAKVNDIPKEFIVNDKKNNLIRLVRIKRDKDGPNVSLDRTIFLFSVDNMTEYQSIEKDTKQYSLDITNNRGKRKQHIESADVNALTRFFKNNALFVGSPLSARDMINHIVTLKYSMGELKLEDTPPYKGIFYDEESELLYSNLDSIEEVNKIDIAYAIDILEHFVDEFDNFKRELGYILHWIAYAPFSFAKKQCGVGGFAPAILLYGTSQTGKSTSALLCCHIWNLKPIDYSLSGSDVNTPYQFARAMSQDTFPRVVDEGEDLYQNTELINILKNVPEKIHSRSRQDSAGAQVSSLALSNMIITSNKGKPDEGALTVRLKTIEIFGKPKTMREVQLFNEKYSPHDTTGLLSNLQCIGYKFIEYMMADESLIKMKWDEAAFLMWERLYEEADRKLPSWLTNPIKPDSIHTSLLSEDDQIIEDIKRVMLSKWSSRDAEIVKKELNIKYITTIDKLMYLAKNGILPWFKYSNPKRGRYANKERLIITKGIERDLKNVTGEHYNLKRIADLLEGTYHPRGAWGAGKRGEIIAWDKEEFEDLMKD